MLSEQSGIQVDKFYPPVDWQYSFPEGYTRLEYLESTGTQYIDTGVNASSDLTIDTEFYLQSGCLFGYSGTIDGINKSYGYDTRADNGLLRIGIGYISGNSNYSLNNWLKLHIENNYDKTTLNDLKFTNNINFGNADFSNGGNITICKYNGLSVNNFVGKIKYFNIKQNGDLVRNFVPAKRNSDNKPGMYDLVNNVFYVNQGTGEFVMGPELYSNNSQIDIRQKNNTNFVEKYKFNANNELVWANPNLYLESTGTQCINTRLISNIENTFEIKVFITSLSHLPRFRNDQFLTGSPAGGTSFYRNSTSVWGYLKYNNNSLSNYQNYYYDKIYTLKSKIENNKYNLYINGSLLKSVDVVSTTTTGIYTLFDTGGNANTSFGRIYYCKIYDDNNNLKYHFVPVPVGLQIGDFTVPSNGMFDIVNQQFYGNTGTGSFKFGQTRDIKVIPPEDNTITLLYGVVSDFSKYALFGLLANVSSGTYDVYIDDVLFATTASGTQTDIDFSTLGSEYVSIGTCTTPEELVLHKIVIKPTTSGQTISAFRCAKTSGTSGLQYQGLLWMHLELENNINLNTVVGASSNWINEKLLAITSKGDIVNLTGSSQAFIGTKALQILPKLKNAGLYYLITASNTLKRLILINPNMNLLQHFTDRANNLEKIDCLNPNINNTSASAAFTANYKLKMLPKIKSSSTNMSSFVTDAINLYPTKFDITNNTNLEQIDMKGSSTYPMRGLRGLKVSNEAPFSGTSPQINVSYTGLDRDALVELFESMPGYMPLTKVGEPTIDSNGVVSGFSNSNYLQINNGISVGQNFEIYTKFTTGASLSGNQELITGKITSDLYLRIFIQNGATLFTSARVVGASSISNNTTSYSFQTNTTYSVKVKYDGINKLDVFIYDVIGQQVKTNSFTLSNQINTFNSLLIGTVGTSSSVWSGSIDLKNSYITINNARYQFQLPDDTTTRAINITAATGNNLTKVGTPTIDANGIASGFSSSIYLQFPNITVDGSYEIHTKFTTGTLSTSVRTTIIGTPYIYGIWGFNLETTKKIYSSIRFSSKTYSSTVDIILSDNTTYYAKAILKNNTYQCFLSTDNINWTGGNIINIPAGSTLIQPKSGSPNAGALRIGGGTQQVEFGGSIDLEETYVKVGQNYIVKGYLIDNDRLIATNKGWTLV